MNSASRDKLGLNGKGTLPWVSVQYWTVSKNCVETGELGQGLKNRCEVGCELVLLDNQVMLRVVLDQVEVPESLHEYADPRPRSPYHCRQLFMRNPDLDANAPRIFLSQLFGDLQQGLSQTLLAINRHQVGDDLLLVRNTHSQVLDEAFEEGVFCQALEKPG